MILQRVAAGEKSDSVPKTTEFTCLDFLWCVANPFIFIYSLCLKRRLKCWIRMRTKINKNVTSQ